MHPLFFHPILKRIVWGGRRLGDLLGKPIGEGSDYAESWEIVDHGDHHSVVRSGPHAGTTLRHLMRDRREEMMGRHAGQETFPLLLKYLDCNRVLSVQVHPDDEYARRMARPDLGKTEAWYVVDAVPGSKIYAGLRAGVGRRELESAVRAGRTEEVLHVIEPRVGQCVFIPAGTVHALGGGLVVAEIQQSSDTTFRLYDWNRVGDDGKPRPLHIDQAIEVTNFTIGPISPQQPTADTDGFETLVDCDKFVLRGATLDESSDGVSIGGDSLAHLVTVVSGRVGLRYGDGDDAVAEKGQSFLIPAASEPVTMRGEGDAVLLAAHLPL
jgi:mannose-6-phosphate isomerase